MRTLLVVLLAACSSTTRRPEPPPAPTTAPIPFTADEIRDAMPVGTEIKLSMESPGKPTVIQHWVVIDADAAGCTIASRLLDENGELIEDEGTATSAWEELRQHAAFPVDATTITDATVTVPAGTFETKLYEVKQDGGVRRMHFAPKLPGPPIDMVVEVGGQVVMHMRLISRAPSPP